MNHTQRRPVTLLLALGLSLTALTSCANAQTTTSRTSGAVGAQPTVAELRAGVVAAVHANHELSVDVLWTNRIPSDAGKSTRGPALTALRASAAQREKQGVRVRMLHDTYRIISVRLNKARTTATAVAQSIQKLAPSHLNGKPLGRPIELNERASLLLHRLGSSRTFVVWKVDLIK